MLCCRRYVSNIKHCLRRFSHNLAGRRDVRQCRTGSLYFLKEIRDIKRLGMYLFYWLEIQHTASYAQQDSRWSQQNSVNAKQPFSICNRYMKSHIWHNSPCNSLLYRSSSQLYKQAARVKLAASSNFTSHGHHTNRHVIEPHFAPIFVLNGCLILKHLVVIPRAACTAIPAVSNVSTIPGGTFR